MHNSPIHTICLNTDFFNHHELTTIGSGWE
nr:hypothetical protein [Bacillus sp. 166amftsu]